MQKFEDSFDGAYSSSGKKNQQQSTKKTKIIINVAGINIFYIFIETQYPVVKQHPQYEKIYRQPLCQICSAQIQRSHQGTVSSRKEKSQERTRRVFRKEKSGFTKSPGTAHKALQYNPNHRKNAFE